MTRGEATAAFAMSHDGRLLAHTVGWDVQIHDAATMAPVGPPLHSTMSSMAYPIKLAFSPDDSSLVGNEGSWVLWPLASDSRPAAELRMQMQLLNPSGGGDHLLQVPSTQERTGLRGSDPGPPVADSATPTPRVARYVDGFPILARDPAASPLLLDLTRAYTRSTEFVGDYTSSIKAGTLGYWFGIVRIDGVDYDARGAVEIRRTGRRNDSETPMRFKGIPVPVTPIAAFHVLMYAPQAVPTSEVRDYAYLRVHYTDGGSALLRIRTQREVLAPTSVGWVRGQILTMLGSSRLELYSNPRLPNPHPEKLIATIDLEAADEGFSEPMFYAVTAEPVIAAADNGKDKAGNPNAAPKPSLPP
jgi:hypothetical protein